MTIVAATDGSALGNPGPAGWAWYVDDSCWASGGWAHGTNNMGELTAVLDLLQQTAHVDDDVEIYADSMYVINTITKWMAGWKRKGWRKRDGKPVLNVEIIKGLDEAMQGRRVKFHWVKGHAGHPLNEAADLRANAVALAFKEGRTFDPGPGFTGGTSQLPDATVGQQENEPDLFSELSELSDDIPVTSSPQEQIVALERSLLTDEVRGDPAALAALLHPDWQEIGRSGRLRTRQDILAEIGPVPPVTLEVESVTQVAPDVWLLIWRAIAEDRETLRSSLWVRAGESWRQIFHQGTPL